MPVAILWGFREDISNARGCLIVCPMKRSSVRESLMDGLYMWRLSNDSVLKLRPIEDRDDEVV
jgi:hypothetical protein